MPITPRRLKRIGQWWGTNHAGPFRRGDARGAGRAGLRPTALAGTFSPIRRAIFRNALRAASTFTERNCFRRRAPATRVECETLKPRAAMIDDRNRGFTAQKSHSTPLGPVCTRCATTLIYVTRPGRLRQKDRYKEPTAKPGEIFAQHTALRKRARPVSRAGPALIAQQESRAHFRERREVLRFDGLCGKQREYDNGKAVENHLLMGCMGREAMNTSNNAG